ncbi:MAG: transglutaminase-like cysteine peptidase [Candidatus Bathyarchaeota archaeon]|nr:transglutaminase-like cysteine peptidase [Candidatus Bathyarchaeota archaeon]
MGKLAWILVIAVVVVVVFKFPEFLDPQFYSGIFGQETDDEIERFVQLDVTMKESGQWLGSGSYVGNVTYFVHNLGNANASDVHVSLSVNDAVLEDFVLPSIVSGDVFSDSISVSVSGSESKLVMLNASCANSSDTAAFTMQTALKRAAFNLQSAKLYITPDDPMVLEALANITTNPVIPDWIEIRDWVSKNVEYAYDEDVHGVTEYWQFANETLTLGTGDCEDFSILLCSLLRANGWDANEVYVVMGAKDSQYHGWVKLNVDVMGWQSLEPQAGALNTLVGDFLTLDGFEAMYMVNDQYFETL